MPVWLSRPSVPEHALRYLSTYTQPVAISNHRLVALANGNVTVRQISRTFSRLYTMRCRKTEAVRHRMVCHFVSTF
ncbi:MAG TPA: transposase [Edaphobacter sp.]|jgi:hypothetical protein|nr:transposase [Edaphobacter sp.]